MAAAGYVSIDVGRENVLSSWTEAKTRFVTGLEMASVDGLTSSEVEHLRSEVSELERIQRVADDELQGESVGSICGYEIKRQQKICMSLSDSAMLLAGVIGFIADTALNGGALSAVKVVCAGLAIASQVFSKANDWISLGSEKSEESLKNCREVVKDKRFLDLAKLTLDGARNTLTSLQTPTILPEVTNASAEALDAVVGRISDITEGSNLASRKTFKALVLSTRERASRA